MMNIHTLFPSRYVKAPDLKGREVTVTMARVAIEKMGNPPEDKPVLFFQNAGKGLVLNKTIGMQIAALYGPETDDWAGKRITIYPTQVRAFGGQHEVIRVKDQRPPAVVNGHKKAEEEHAAEVLSDQDEYDTDDAHPDGPFRGAQTDKATSA